MTKSSDTPLETTSAGAIDINDIDGAGVVTPGLVKSTHEACVWAAFAGCPELMDASLPDISLSSKDELSASGFSQPLVLRDYCLRPWGSSCSRCEQLCPRQAISLSFNDAPRINPECCNDCGLCAGVCDAFVVPDCSLTNLYETLRSKFLRYGEVIITCKHCIAGSETPADNVVLLPSLAMLSPEFLAALLTEGTDLTVAGALSSLFDETHGGLVAEVLFEESVRLAEEWSGQKLGYREEVPSVQELPETSSDMEKTRREYFDDLVALFRGDTDGLFADTTVIRQETAERRRRLYQRQALSGLEIPRVNAFMPGQRLKQTLWPKRRLLLEAFSRLPAMEERVMLRISQTDTDRCNDCLACVEPCPSKARFAHSQDGLLEFDARYCIGCGLCEACCPEQAISLELLEPGVDVNDTDSSKDPAL